MPLLDLIGFVAGMVAGISPCVLPVLPVVLAAGATPVGVAAGHGETAAPPIGTRSSVPPWWRRLRRGRPLAVVLGLALSFGATTLFGSWLLDELGLRQDLLLDLGLALLGLVALGLLVPPLGEVLERPFRRVGGYQPSGRGGGFVLGLALGPLFVPCAGPVLTAISAVGSTHHFSLDVVLLTACFALGTAVPLLVVALAGQAMATRVSWLKLHGRRTRQIAGGVLIVMMVLLASSALDGLQRTVPGYTSALQKAVEGGGYAHDQLAAVQGQSPGTLGDCTPGAPVLENCGAAPNFTKVTAWLNTPGDRPLTIAGLRGKVVLVDFWTYSCINCQRSLPHVEAWYARYHDDGFEVVGVHSPEFAFEHVVSNVESAATKLGVDYPIAVDDDLGTWNAYQNQYWPAEYLVDATGRVRHVDFGEGDYSTSEDLIRQLLVAAHPTLHLPAPTQVPDRTPTEPLTPESYLGYERLENYAGPTAIGPDVATTYALPASLPPSSLAMSGTWTVHSWEMTAGHDAELELSFQASDVYLVLGGSGTITASVDGGPSRTVTVSGIPDLYTMAAEGHETTGTLLLSCSPGIEAYDFTFG